MRRHILLVTEFYYPDVCASAVVAADHATRIARLRPEWRVSVIAGDRAWDDPSVTHPPRGRHEGVEMVRVARPPVSRVNLIRRALGFAAFGRRAVAAARRLEGVDLVIGTTAPPQGGMIARRIARAHRCPFIYKVLDLYPDLAVTLERMRPGSFLHRRWHSADAKAMRDAAAVVCVSERMRRRVVETRWLSSEHVLAIHDGFDPVRLAINNDGGDFQRDHNPRGRFLVQYAGNMGLSHPFDAILEAARRLTARGDMLFQFIGDGPQRAAIDRDLPPCAQLLPYQPAERLGAVLAAADVCLVSQHTAMFDQALPYKVYAILAAGRPCIFLGNARSEIAEWLASSGAGAVVAQHDVDGLVAAIERYAGDARRRAQAGAAARKLFEDRFDSRRAAEQWVACIERIIRKP